MVQELSPPVHNCHWGTRSHSGNSSTWTSQFPDVSMETQHWKGVVAQAEKPYLVKEGQEKPDCVLVSPADRPGAQLGPWKDCGEKLCFWRTKSNVCTLSGVGMGREPGGVVWTESQGNSDRETRGLPAERC